METHTHKPAIVPNKEIEILKEWINGDQRDVEIDNLKVGDNHTITKGVFKGKDGIVNEINNKRVQLILEPLGIKITIAK